jgi:disulfide bond formation protein DsbB
MNNNAQNNFWNYTFASWVVSLIATLGSLFFSEVMEFPPCILCWYQRIAMYPLVIIFLIGALKGDKLNFVYSFPFIITGWLISLYHNLLYYEIIPESASPCLEGVSCSAIFLDWFNFIDIPLLSFTAFTILGILSLKLRRIIKNG